MKVLNVGCGERFMVKALNVDPNMHKDDIPKGINHAWEWIGCPDDKLVEKDVDLIFFTNSLRYNDNMLALARRLKEITSEEAIIEIKDYIEDPYNEDTEVLTPEWYRQTYIKPLEDVGFKVVDHIEGNGEVFFRLCTCSRKDVQY